MKLKYYFIVILFFSPILVFSRSSPENSKVLAVVGSHKITLNEFTDRYEDYLVYSGVEDNMQLRFSILNNMINEILLHNYDNNAKVFNNPEYKKEIRWAKDEALLAFFKDREIYSKITVTESEMREAFKRLNTKLKVRHLYAHTEKEADNLYSLLKSGADFKKLAKQVFTDSILQNNGGNLGYITYGQTDPDFENAAFSLKVGEISKPVKTAQGYSIIKLENKIENPMMTENEYVNMRHKLERGLKISKKEPYEKAYLNKIFGKNKIKFIDKSIENIFYDLKNSAVQNAGMKESAHTEKNDCVVYLGRTYSQAEIENMLNESPKYNLEKLTSVKKVEDAVLGLLMKKKLLKMAEEKEYDTTSYVTSTYNKLANDIYLNYKRSEILSRVNIPDSELYKYYNDNISYYSSERQMDVQEIIFTDADLDIILEKKLNSGEDFGALAERYSIRQWSAKNKGEMGLSPVSNFGEFKDTLWNTTIGKIIGPLKFDKYYGFFKVLKKQDGKPIDFNLIKSQVLNNVRNEKGFPYMKKHIDALSKKVDIKVNDDILKNYKINLAG
jgi:parvulin-like peptidyl-prolyl isomerase